jgi:hypothetical protein
MTAPSIDTASVTTTSITVTWTAPTGANAGGSSVSVTSYDLKTSTDGTTWTPLVTGHTSTSYPHTVTAGSTTYYYQIRATNKYGTQSTFSGSSTGTVATAKPSKPASPLLEEVGTSINITWTAPDSNYATITSYKVFIKPSTGSTYLENTTLCDGSQAVTVSSLKCLVPMSSLL